MISEIICHNLMVDPGSVDTLLAENIGFTARRVTPISALREGPAYNRYFLCFRNFLFCTFFSKTKIAAAL